MSWIKLLFYFMVIYFNYSVLRTDILLGVGLIAVEVIIVGKFKGGSGSNRGFFNKDNKKIEKLLDKLIMLELMKREDNSINDEELESSIRFDRFEKNCVFGFP